MSIATEIQRLQTAKADIRTAIEEKGVEVGDGLIDTYAEKQCSTSKNRQTPNDNPCHFHHQPFSYPITVSIKMQTKSAYR